MTLTNAAHDDPGLTAPAARLRAEALQVGYGDRTVLDGLDLEILDAGVTTVIGPNGCGKSTLLRALGRLLSPSAGQVLLDGRRIDTMPTREVARALALLPQAPLAPEGLLVADLVARGRHPRQSWLRQWSRADEQVVAEVLTQTGTAALADRPVDELSGGQRQRAWIAMALAQDSDLLLLDEPTTYLDLAHQVEVLELVHRLAHPERPDARRRTVVMVLHDLNLAARYSDRLVAMRDGCVVAAGTPADVLTPELLRDVFGLDAVVVADPVSGGPLVVPRRSLSDSP